MHSHVRNAVWDTSGAARTKYDAISSVLHLQLHFAARQTNAKHVKSQFVCFIHFAHSIFVFIIFIFSLSFLFLLFLFFSLSFTYHNQIYSTMSVDVLAYNCTRTLNEFASMQSTALPVQSSWPFLSSSFCFSVFVYDLKFMSEDKKENKKKIKNSISFFSLPSLEFEFDWKRKQMRMSSWIRISIDKHIILVHRRRRWINQIE